MNQYSREVEAETDKLTKALSTLQTTSMTLGSRPLAYLLETSDDSSLHNYKLIWQ